MNSRALVLESFGSSPRLLDRPVPEPAEGHTLIRVHAAQVGHLDLDVAAGRFGILPDLPAVPGTEACGTVLASTVHPEGALVRVRGAGVGLRRDGGWADHLVAPDAAVLPVPRGTDPVLACCFFSPAGSAWAAVHAVAGVAPGERVLVTGAAGAVGSLTVQVAAAAGAEVTGVVGRPAKLGHVPPQAAPVLAADLAGEGAEQVDVLIDTVGGALLRDALRLVRPRGRAVLVGYTAGREFAVDLADFLFADVALLPLNMMSRAPELAGEADRLLAGLIAGDLVLPIERYGIDEHEEAVRRLRSGEAVGKVAFDLGPVPAP